MATPLILSLVYDHGTILASKRSPYHDLIDEGECDLVILEERLHKQHKLICAAIKGGRIEDLKRMTAKNSAASKSRVLPEIEMPSFETPELVLNHVGYETLKMPRFSPDELSELLNAPSIDEAIIEVIEENSAPELEIFQDTTPHLEDVITEIFDDNGVRVDSGRLVLNAIRESFVSVNSGENEIEENVDLFELETQRIPKPSFGFVQQVATVVAEEMIFPDDAVAIVSENMSSPTKSPDSLSIKLADESEFIGGDRRTLQISVCKGNDFDALVKAHVIIKILGSSFRPMIFHAKTGPDGIAIVHLQLPSFKTGRAVLLIRALHDGEETEVRYSVTQGGTPTAW